MEKLSPSDTLFLDLDTPNTHMTIGAVTIVDKPTAADFDLKRDIKNHIESRLHLSPNMRRKLVFHPFDLEEPRLVDAPGFDIDFHLRFKTLPAPNDWTTLTDMVGELISTPMDMSQPLWEYYIIDGLSNIDGMPETCFAFLTKFHHAVFDGGSAGATMWQFMQDAPGDTVTPPTLPWQPAKEPNLYDWTMSSMIENTKLWSQGMESMQGVSSGIMNLMSRPKEDKPKSPKKQLAAPSVRFSKGLGPDRSWDSVAIPMGELQQLRAALGKPKMNDIFLTIVAGGIRHYLQKTDELPDESLLSICPISVRENNPLEGGNYLSAMRVPLYTDIADPLERLKEIGSSSSSAKDTVQLLGNEFAAHALGMTPYTTRKNLIGGLHALPNYIDLPEPPLLANVTISNAPPPKGGHYFANGKVITSTGYGPLFNYMGVTVVITGMDFESSIGITACKKLLPDIHVFSDCIRQSYQELQTAAGITSADQAGKDETKLAPPKAEKPARKAPQKATRRKASTGAAATRRTRKPTAKEAATKSS